MVGSISGSVLRRVHPKQFLVNFIALIEECLVFEQGKSRKVRPSYMLQWSSEISTVSHITYCRYRVF